MTMAAMRNIRQIFTQNSLASIISTTYWHWLNRQQQTSLTRRYSLISQYGQDLQYVLEQMDMSMLSKSIQLCPDHTKSPPPDKYQYAIYELFNAEINIYCNINKLIHIYQKPMLSYRLISPEESLIIFSDLSHLAEIHLNLIKNLAMLQNNGSFSCPVNALMEFIESLHYYEVYCINLIHSKSTLKRKMQQKPFVDFLHSEQVRQYGQKLDLASFLDQPRRHLMKYPLLLKEICRRAVNQDEINHLTFLNNQISSFIHYIDDQISVKKYQELMKKFEHSKANRTKFGERIERTCSRLIMSSDVQRWKKPWLKNHLILLDRMLILIRCSTLTSKFTVQFALENGGDLYYVCGNRRTTINHRSTTNRKWRLKKTNRNVGHHQHHHYHSHNKTSTTKWLRLYSNGASSGNHSNNTINGYHFDITIKFKHNDELNVWLRKLSSFFNMIHMK